MNKQQSIEEYYNYSCSIATGMCASRGLKDKEDIHDITSICVTNGLVNAVETYDETKGTSLKTWIGLKVRGAALDEFRRRYGIRMHRDVVREHPTKPNWTNATNINRIRALNFVRPDSINDFENSLLLSVDGIERKVCCKDIFCKAFEFLRSRADSNVVDVFYMYFVEGDNLTSISRRLGYSDSRAHQIYSEWIPKLRKYFLKLGA